VIRCFCSATECNDIVFNASVSVSIEDNVITFSRATEAPDHRSKHGLYRALVHNMIQGVSEGFKKDMEVIGVGYRANATGQQLELALGFSHAIIMEIPKEVKVTTVTEKVKLLSFLSSHTTSNYLVK